jgi:hypothetical protein
MDLLLHVGLHKTATTTVQACLVANKQALNSYGILYPSTGLWGGIQHALIPASLIADHPFLGDSSCTNSLQEYLEDLQVELAEFSPSLVVMSSEVFTEVIGNKKACLSLVDDLSRLFSSTTILLTLRDSKAMALSCLKHLVRENFADSSAKFSDSFLNPVLSFFKVALASDDAIRFWHESGMPVYERKMEEAPGSHADFYFGDIFDQYNKNARQLLSPESNAAIGQPLHLNSDDLIPVAYLVLFLMGNATDSKTYVDLNALAIVLEECQAANSPSGFCDSLNHNQLLGYFDYFSKADPASLAQYIPISQKLNALTHAGLTPAEILDIFTVVHRVKLRLAIS